MDFFGTITRGLRHIQITHYTQLSSACIVIFDHLITLDAEIKLIWPSSWTVGKVLFFLNRYHSLAAVIFNTYGLFLPQKSVNFCLRFYRWQGWTGLICCLLAQAILQTRLYALYCHDRKLLAVMFGCFAITASLSGYVMGYVLSKLTIIPIDLPNEGVFCLASNIASNFYMFWIPLLAFECMLCGLALFKGIRTLRRQKSVFQSGRLLIDILVRDSIIYFLAICATYLSSLLIWILAPTTLMEVPIGFTLAMSCVMANRVILNVKEIGKTADTLTESRRPVTRSVIGDMSFCSPGTLSQFEMGHLRSMRVGRHLEDICEEPDEYDFRKAPWVVQ